MHIAPVILHHVHIKAMVKVNFFKCSEKHFTCILNCDILRCKAVISHTISLASGVISYLVTHTLLCSLPHALGMDIK